LAAEFPGHSTHRAELGRTYQSLASFFTLTNRDTAAAQARRKADELFGMKWGGGSFALPHELQEAAKKAADAGLVDSKSSSFNPEPTATTSGTRPPDLVKAGLAQFDQRPTVHRPIFDMNSITDLVQAPALLDLLKLTAGEREQITECVKKSTESEDATLVLIQQLPLPLRTFTQAEWVRQTAASRRPTVAKIQSILGPDRFARLREVRWQVIGLNGLHGLELQRELGITREQIQPIRTALGAIGGFPHPPAVRGYGYSVRAPREHREKLDFEQVLHNQDEKDKRAFPLLTPEQQERWRKLCGAPIDAATKRTILEAVDALY
jgi:hypothetical protein